MGEFWRNIRKSRKPLNSNNKSISRFALETHFTELFSYDKINENESITAARNTVRMKLMNCPAMYDDFIFTEYRLRRYIKRLKSGNASGTDKSPLIILPITQN